MWSIGCRASASGPRSCVRTWSTNACVTAATRARREMTPPTSATGRGPLRRRLVRSGVRVLVVNAGSSTLKLTLLDSDDRVLAARELQAPGGAVERDELNAALAQGLAQPDAVGHRIVHGGERFRNAVRIDIDVEAALRELVDLAPLH